MRSLSCRIIFGAGCDGVGGSFAEERTKDVGLITSGEKAFVELPDFFVDVDGIGTQGVDTVDHAHHQAGDDSRWVSRMRGNVQVQVECFLIQGGVDALIIDG